MPVESVLNCKFATIESKRRSFEDVLASDYDVIVFKDTANHGLLETSKPNSAMNQVQSVLLKRDMFLQFFLSLLS